MEPWSEAEVEGSAGPVGQAGVTAAVAPTSQQSGVVLMLVKRDEVTSDWLSFFL